MSRNGSDCLAPASTEGQPWTISIKLLPEVVRRTACDYPVCGGSDFIRSGEAVSGVLDYIPASFRIVRHVQPRFTCKGCDTDIKATMPSLPIELGKPGGRSCRTCAHRQILRSSFTLSAIRDLCAEGVDLSRSVGKASALLGPSRNYVRTSSPAAGRIATTRRFRCWSLARARRRPGGRRTYIRDGRRWGDETPPAVSYFYGPARKGEHSKAHVADFSGILHADGYAGFRDLMKQPTRQTRRHPGRSAGRMSAASSSI